MRRLPDSMEAELRRVLYMNQQMSAAMQQDSAMTQTRIEADANIAGSIELLRSLGKGEAVDDLLQQIASKSHRGSAHRAEMASWEELLAQSECYLVGAPALEDLLTQSEIQAAFDEREAICREFAQATRICNQTDLAFLTVATALQTAKALLFPYVAESLGYGYTFDLSLRLAHNDDRIEKAHRQASDRFRDRHVSRHGTGAWIRFLVRQVSARANGCLGWNWERRRPRIESDRQPIEKSLIRPGSGKDTAKPKGSTVR